MGHFYTLEGNKRFDVGPAKAKQENLLFSVNEQFKMLAKPGLDVWKENELAKAAFHSPPESYESEAQYVKRVKQLRFERTGGAADLGTRIHAQIEEVLEGKRDLEDVPKSLIPYVKPAVNYIWDKGFLIKEIEKVVVSKDHTFAGTVDLIGLTKDNKPFIADWKTKKSVKGKPFAPYPENKWQIAAYAAAHFGEKMLQYKEVWGVNFFISSNEMINGEARFEAHAYKPQEMVESWETVKLLFELHRRIQDYDPRK